MVRVELGSLKKGSLFRLSSSETAPLWVRSFYDRSSKMYEIYRYDNVNESRFYHGIHFVYVEC